MNYDNIQRRDNNDENRKYIQIPLTTDCVTLLLKNRHFEEWINVEKWNYKKPIEESYLCPYSKSLFNH